MSNFLPATLGIAAMLLASTSLAKGKRAERAGEIDHQSRYRLCRSSGFKQLKYRQAVPAESVENSDRLDCSKVRCL